MPKIRLLTTGVIAGLLLTAPGAQAPRQAGPREAAPRPQASTFASQIAALSEPAGYFDTDNLISNEGSYLEVIPDLRRAGFRGGAYVGVGPDQNFSYIAAVRPSVAYIIDIRRDNLLLHLLFKALFELSRSRVEYLALLLGRPVPPASGTWRDASIQRIVGYIDASRVDAASPDRLRERVSATIARFAVPLSREDLGTIDRFHRRFIDAGLGLRFQTTGRPPQSHYPTYRELLLGTDPAGKTAGYLATEEAFLAVKTLQADDLVIPVVGNLSGPSALAAIGGAMAQRGQPLTALYASNVEFYLFGDGTFADFAANLRRLPHDNKSLIIRSVFGRYAGPGGPSSSHTQPVARLLDSVSQGRIRTYRDLLEF